MGQSKSVHLEAQANAQARQVRFKLLCDWGDYGFGYQDTYTSSWAGQNNTWSDESAYVESMRGDMQATSFLSSASAVGQGVSSVCYVTLQNPENASGHRRFSLGDPGGDLYDYIGDGHIRMVRAVVRIGFAVPGSIDEVLNQMTGYIVGLDEIEHGRRVVLEIRDRGIDCVQTRASTDLYTNILPGSYIRNLLGELSRDTLGDFTLESGEWQIVWMDDDLSGGYGTAYLDPGLFQLYYAWSESERIQDELNRVAEANMGRVWWDKDGNIHFDDGGHWVRPNTNAWDDPLTSQFDFDEGDFAACQPYYELDDQYTHVVVSYTPRYKAGQQVIYSASESFVVPPNATMEILAEFKYPADNVEDPVANTDYAATTPGGTDISSDVTVTMTIYAEHAEIRVVNANQTYSACITGLSLRGEPIYPRQRMQYESETDWDNLKWNKGISVG
jgi:hypothetical protein